MISTPTSQIVLVVVATCATLFIICTFVFFLLFNYQKQRTKFDRGIKEIKEEYEQMLSQTKSEIQEQTLESISREIHDNISLTLTLAKLNLTTCELDSSSIAFNKVAESISLLTKSIDELRDLSRSLSQDTIGYEGLPSALEAEISRVSRITNISINLSINGESKFLPSDVETVVFRIVQEGLNNIIKHSRATRADVSIIYEEKRMKLQISDNGIGMDDFCNKKSGSGLKNMKNRSRIFGGSFEIRSSAENGTTILIQIPI